MQTAKTSSVQLQLDIEDYYPGEGLYFNKAHEKANRMHLMQSAFDRANAITYASEGIALECQKQFEIAKHVKQRTILNAFSSAILKNRSVRMRRLNVFGFHSI